MPSWAKVQTPLLLSTFYETHVPLVGTLVMVAALLSVVARASDPLRAVLVIVLGPSPALAFGAHDTILGLRGPLLT